MCDTVYQKCFNLDNICQGNIVYQGRGKILIKGNIRRAGKTNGTLTFWAANPPDYLTSYSGSALPFPNSTIAFENTPNKGKVPYVNGTFEFLIHFPNAYYTGIGSVYTPPQIYIQLDNSPTQVYPITVSEGIPYRTLTYPNTRIDPFFYERHWDNVSNQEQLFRKTGYPSTNKMPKDFWNSA